MNCYEHYGHYDLPYRLFHWQVSSFKSHQARQKMNSLKIVIDSFDGCDLAPILQTLNLRSASCNSTDNSTHPFEPYLSSSYSLSLLSHLNPQSSLTQILPSCTLSPFHLRLPSCQVYQTLCFITRFDYFSVCQFLVSASVKSFNCQFYPFLDHLFS